MLLLRVAGISLKCDLKVLAIGSGSLTMMPLSQIELFCDRCFLPWIEFLLDQTF